MVESLRTMLKAQGLMPSTSKTNKQNKKTRLPASLREVSLRGEPGSVAYEGPNGFSPHLPSLARVLSHDCCPKEGDILPRRSIARFKH